jgi:hypothetical protein
MNREEACNELRYRIAIGKIFSRAKDTPERHALMQEYGYSREKMYYFRKMRFTYENVLHYLENITQTEIERINYLYATDTSLKINEVFGFKLTAGWDIITRCLITDEAKKERVWKQKGYKTRKPKKVQINPEVKAKTPPTIKPPPPKAEFFFEDDEAAVLPTQKRFTEGRSFCNE